MKSKCLLLFLVFFILDGNELFAQEKPRLHMGGAFRFNYNLSSWKAGQKKRGGDFGYDVFRINAKASYKKLYLDAEYRLYSQAFGGGVLKQGWMGYRINEENEIHVGLTQVPFGITQYNSDNWFFNLTYYVGLEDDHDMGLKYQRSTEHLDLSVAFFKNAEELQFGGRSESLPNRYSYDVTGNNKEVNQGNIQLVYKEGDTLKHRIGVSAQAGGLYNLNTEQMGNHYAFAVHYEAEYKLWNLKLQALTAAHNAKTDVGEPDEVVEMGAYGANYTVASDFNMYTVGLSRKIPVSWGPISSLTVYNDFGYMQKHNKAFEKTMMNVTGLMVTAGNIYTYIDYAAGYNQPWLGPEWTNALGEGTQGRTKWEARFNVNMGYYF